MRDDGSCSNNLDKAQSPYLVLRSKHLHEATHFRSVPFTMAPVTTSFRRTARPPAIRLAKQRETPTWDFLSVRGVLVVLVAELVRSYELSILGVSDVPAHQLELLPGLLRWDGARQGWTERQKPVLLSQPVNRRLKTHQSCL